MWTADGRGSQVRCRKGKWPYAFSNRSSKPARSGKWQSARSGNVEACCHFRPNARSCLRSVWTRKKKGGDNWTRDGFRNLPVPELRRERSIECRNPQRIRVADRKQSATLPRLGSQIQRLLNWAAQDIELPSSRLHKLLHNLALVV